MKCCLYCSALVFHGVMSRLRYFRCITQSHLPIHPLTHILWPNQYSAGLPCGRSSSNTDLHNVYSQHSISAQSSFSTAMQRKIIQSNVKQCNAKQCNPMQSNAKQCKTMQNHAKHCKALQSNAKQCKAMQSNAMQSNAKQCKAMQRKARQCNAKQGKAKQSNAKQHICCGC